MTASWSCRHWTWCCSARSRSSAQHVVDVFGAEFPIRFDFLDTMGGGNLSFQVHPDPAYIRDTFRMPYTQDESYYLVDAAPDATVYLGLRDDVDPDEMIAALAEANDGGAPFDAERFANRWPAKKHDHFLIPAGTLHCSGANSMVLEISATPYLFTFKLWDWGRMGLDGRPRPIHLDHGKKVISWERTTEWVREHLVNRIEPVAAGDGWTEERTGLHELEFIETRRHRFEAHGPARHRGDRQRDLSRRRSSRWCSRARRTPSSPSPCTTPRSSSCPPRWARTRFGRTARPPVRPAPRSRPSCATPRRRLHRMASSTRGCSTRRCGTPTIEMFDSLKRWMGLPEKLEEALPLEMTLAAGSSASCAVTSDTRWTTEMIAVADTNSRQRVHRHPSALRRPDQLRLRSLAGRSTSQLNRPRARPPRERTRASGRRG